MDFLISQTLLTDPQEDKLILNMAVKVYMVLHGILYYEGLEVPGRCCVVVMVHLRPKIFDEHYDLPFSGHFAAKKISQYFWKGTQECCPQEV